MAASAIHRVEGRGGSPLLLHRKPVIAVAVALFGPHEVDAARHRRLPVGALPVATPRGGLPAEPEIDLSIISSKPVLPGFSGIERAVRGPEVLPVTGARRAAG